MMRFSTSACRTGRVEDDVGAERDEGVDRTDHEPGEEELEQVRGVRRG
jgi:hypothetical protein